MFRKDAILRSLYLLLFYLTVTRSWDTGQKIQNMTATEMTIFRRLEKLEHVSKVFRSSTCNRDQLVVLTGSYGNSGNHLIQFTNALWFANMMNSTLLVPMWMQNVLMPFNLTTLHNNHCFTENTLTSAAVKTKFEITAEESYFIFLLQKHSSYKNKLPDFSHQATLADISVHFIKVYAALWSAPIVEIQQAAVWLIDNYLEGSFDYTTGDSIFASIGVESE